MHLYPNQHWTCPTASPCPPALCTALPTHFATILPTPSCATPRAPQLLTHLTAQVWTTDGSSLDALSTTCVQSVVAAYAGRQHHRVYLLANHLTEQVGAAPGGHTGRACDALQMWQPTVCTPSRQYRTVLPVPQHCARGQLAGRRMGIDNLCRVLAFSTLRCAGDMLLPACADAVQDLEERGWRQVQLVRYTVEEVLDGGSSMGMGVHRAAGPGSCRGGATAAACPKHTPAT